MYKLMAALTVARFAVERKAKEFFSEENGEVNIIATIIILAIAIALAVVFRKQITTLFDNVWKEVAQDTKWGDYEGVFK